MTTLTPQEEAQQAESEALCVLTASKAMVVTTEQEYRVAGAEFARIKAMLKELEARRVAITGPINQSLKLINDGFKRPKEALEQALAIVERPMVAFQREQEALRKAAEAAAKAEQERLEAQARAEAKRLFDEAEAKRKAAEAAPAPADFLDALDAEESTAHAKAEADRLYQEAQAKVREARSIEVLPEVIVPKVSAAGTSVRKNWKFKIVDASAIPREYLIPDEKRIGEIVRANKDATDIPGIAVYEKLSIGGR